MFAAFVKSTLVPGSEAFLLLGLAVGVVLLYAGKGGARLGRRWLTLVALLYGLLATPAVANALIGVLEPDYPALRTVDDAKGARVLVVVGNGIVRYSAGAHAIHQFARRTAYVLLEGVRIYHLAAPDAIILSGGVPASAESQAPESEVMRDEMIRLGVPPDRILLESSSHDTSEQLSNIGAMVRDRSLSGPIVLVTTPAHARRTLMLAERQGLDVVPSMAGALRYDTGGDGWRVLMPSLAALRGSESAMYEYLALVRDWWTGS